MSFADELSGMDPGIAEPQTPKSPNIEIAKHMHRASIVMVDAAEAAAECCPRILVIFSLATEN